MLSLRPLQNAAFCPISASVSNFNPPPTFGGLILKILNVWMLVPIFLIGAVKIFTFLELEQKSAFFKGLLFFFKFSLFFFKIGRELLKFFKEGIDGRLTAMDGSRDRADLLAVAGL